MDNNRQSLRRLSLQNSVLPSFSHCENLKPEINPIKTILIKKESEVFGVSVNIVDFVGAVVTSLTPESSSAQDGRLQPGDVLVSLNNQSLVDVEPRRIGEILRSVDKSSSDVLVQYIAADNAPEQPTMQSTNLFPPLNRIPSKSDEEEDEYFDVPESEPPELPTSPPPTLVSEILIKTSALTTKPSLPKTEESSSSTKAMLPKISPIILPVAKPSVPSPKPVIRVTSSEATSKGVDSVVTKVKPTVPFKPIRTSLMPKDALPNKAKTKPATLENVVGESPASGISRQWGPQRTVELWRDPEKGLGISIISGKVDSLHGGIFIKNVLADSPAGWNGTLKRGDRILEVNGEDIRNAGHAKAVEVIKNATNPVTFIVQSLVPLPKKTDAEAPIASPEASPSSEESVVKLEMSPSLSKVSPVHSPVNVSLIPNTPSPCSSNSSSRESTIKRSSSKDIPASPSVEVQQFAAETEVPKPVNLESPKIINVEEKDKLKSPADTMSDVLKLWTKKGKQPNTEGTEVPKPFDADTQKVDKVQEKEKVKSPGDTDSNIQAKETVKSPGDMVSKIQAKETPKSPGDMVSKIPAKEKLKSPVVSEVLQKGKVWSKKGKQIDVKSAGNIKLSPSEKSDDSESEDEFGYTHSKN